MRDWLPEVMQCCVSCRGRQACCVVSRLEAPVQGRVFLVGGRFAGLLALPVAHFDMQLHSRRLMTVG